MRKSKVFAVAIFTAALVSPLVAQEEVPAPPPAANAAPPAPAIAPPPGMKARPGRSFAITSKENQPKRIVSGKCMAMVVVPPEIKETSVTISLAGKTFSSTNRPHRVEIDTASIADGDYDATAVAKDESGVEVWKGSAKIAVDNAGKLAPQSPPPPSPMAGAKRSQGENSALPAMNPDDPNAGVVPRPIDKPRKERKNRQNGNPEEPAQLPPAIPTGPEGEPPVPPMPDPGTPVVEPFSPQPSVSVTEVYQNKKFGIKIAYPAGWKVSDNTSQLKPKEPGGFWISFSSPEPAPKLTVNFKHRLLKQQTTPENYAKYNTYLQQWVQSSANGKPAFETMQGLEGSGRIVHRKLIVDGKHIWQFNCIDQTGKPSSDSKAIIEQMISSMGN